MPAPLWSSKAGDEPPLERISRGTSRLLGLSKDEGGRMKDEATFSSLVVHPSSFERKATPRNSKRGRDGGDAAATQDGNRE